MIVIPMAGLSSRFFKAGYREPKYKLMAHGRPLFDHALLSFAAYFTSETFLFIFREDFDTQSFVRHRCHLLGIVDFKLVVLKHETRGQAETVFLGTSQVSDDEALTVFNIDTFRKGFLLPKIAGQSDGYLEVFEGKGNNWSYVKPLAKGSNRVIQTTEKKPISNLCSTGLYHFSKTIYFKIAYEKQASKPQSQWPQSELYIAPLYNELIERGLDIRYHLITKDEVTFCGLPQEYLAFLK